MLGLLAAAAALGIAIIARRRIISARGGVVECALRHRVDRLLTRFGGTLGLAARHLRTGEELGLNADSVFPTASLIKLAVLAELYRQADERALRLDRTVEVTAGTNCGTSFRKASSVTAPVFWIWLWLTVTIGLSAT